MLNFQTLNPNLLNPESQTLNLEHYFLNPKEQNVEYKTHIY